MMSEKGHDISGYMPLIEGSTGKREVWEVEIGRVGDITHFDHIELEVVLKHPCIRCQKNSMLQGVSFCFILYMLITEALRLAEYLGRS